MKSIKVLFNGKHLRDIYPHATRWQVFKYRVTRFTRRLIFCGLVLSAFVGMIYGSYSAGRTFHPNIVYADKIVEVPVTPTIPVLERIAKCESPTGQFKGGQVVLIANKNGTVDIGKNGINLQAWGAVATKMGLDLTKEADNDAMARWIYLNRGTVDWKYSQDCWSK